MSNLNVVPRNLSYFAPILVGRITAAFTGPIFAMLAGTNRVKIRRINYTLAYDGTGNPNTASYGFYRFSGANFTGGTIITPVKKDTVMVASTISGARASASAALGAVGVTKESIPFFITVNQRDPGATTFESHSFEFNNCIVLNSGEGIAIYTEVASVIGDSIAGYIEFDEV